MRRHIILDVTFEDCERVTGVEDLRHLGGLLAQHGLRLVAAYLLSSPDVAPLDAKYDYRTLTDGAAIGDHLAQTWPDTVYSWLQASGDKYPAVYGRKLLVSGMGELQSSMSLGYNSKVARMGVHIGGLVDFEFRDQRAWVEPYARRLHELASALTPELRPALASVDETDSLHALGDVLKRKLKYINWVNVFGPPYVQKYGREFLLGLPGHKVEELPDGSIYHQLSPTLLTEDPKSAKALRQQVVDYCAQARLKVTCKAPYHLAGISPSPQLPKEDAIPDEAVRAYMQEILGTTLVLTDGTRVKPIPVAWRLLTPAQEQMALEMIKAAAVAEIRQHRDRRIRFEFNALPDALDQMMTDLVGRDNPDFEWMQVNMDEVS